MPLGRQLIGEGGSVTERKEEESNTHKRRGW